MSKSIALSVVLGVFLQLWFVVGVDGQRLLPDHESRIPVALTVSGGKSLGSYQAGLNWGLIQGMKHSITAGHEQHGRPYDLRAVTGASAGNINALISAVEWCNDAPLVPPEESLFFKIWVRTGWEQLLTPAPYREQDSAYRSLLHRGFFDRHFEEIDAAMARADPAECDLPIGITLTKQIRGSIALGALDIPTQRFVSIVRMVRTVEDGRGRLRFALPESELRSDSTIGKRVYPNIDGPTLSSEGYELLPAESAYQLTAASSAFPLAFEPERLRVVDPEVPDRTTCDALNGAFVAGGCAMEAQYLDGGLFDNSPLDLALHLFEHRKPELLPSAADTLARLIYIEAGQYRDPLLTVRRRNADEEHHGTAAALQMVSQAIPAARKYELHSLARILRGDPDDTRDNWLRVTDRAFPIVGEHLSGFAAFLGRPFREFDFYVGVYDALHFMVAELCPEEHARNGGEKGVSDSCEAPLLRELIEDRGLELGDYAPSVLAEIYVLEFPGAAAPAVEWPTNDDGRSVLLRALVRANAALLQGVDDTCAGRGAIERTRVRRRFRRDPANTPTRRRGHGGHS